MQAFLERNDLAYLGVTTVTFLETNDLAYLGPVTMTEQKSFITLSQGRSHRLRIEALPHPPDQGHQGRRKR